MSTPFAVELLAALQRAAQAQGQDATNAAWVFNAPQLVEALARCGARLSAEGLEDEEVNVWISRIMVFLCSPEAAKLRVRTNEGGAA